MKQRTMTKQRIVAIGIGMMLTFTAAYSQVLFNDNIDTYSGAIGSSYTSQNAAVTGLAQNNGTDLIETSQGGYTAAPGNQMVVLTPTAGGDVEAISVPISTTTQYGQVYVQLGTENQVGAGTSSYTTLLLSSLSNPVLSGSNPGTAPSASGPSLTIQADGSVYYLNGSHGLSGPTSPGTTTGSISDLTIDYNLTAKTYDLWIGTTEVATDAAFGTGFSGSTINSLVISEDALFNTSTVITDVNWQASDSTPFTSFGAPIPASVPEPSVMALMFFAIGALIFVVRRQKTTKEV